MSLTNQQKAQTYHRAVSSYDVATVKSMIREDYIQHNPRVPTGAAAFLALFPNLEKHQSKIENQRIFQDGDHVIMHHLWKNAAPFGADQKVAFHIIRFDQAGLIAEHWSVMTDVQGLNASGRSQIDGPTEIPKSAETEKNKAKVIQLFGLLIQATPKDFEKIMSQFFKTDFHQHHPKIPDGIQALIKAMAPEKLNLSYKKQHKVFGFGDFILSISEGSLAGTSTAFYDLFRMENGLITERWNVDQEIPSTGLANNNTMFGF